MRKNKLWMIILGILLVIGVCTAISAKHYTDSLTTVTLTSTVPNSIRVTLEVTGEVYYYETAEVEAPVGCRVEEVYVKAGQFVEAGQPLLKLREAELKAAYYQRKLQAEELEKTEESGGTAGELAHWNRQVLLEEISFLENVIAAEGQILAEESGYVIRQTYVEGSLTTANTLMEIGLTEAGSYVEWLVAPEKYREFTLGTAVMDGQEFDLSWEPPLYKDGTYVFRADLPEESGFAQGYPAKIQLIYVSEEYKAVLPKECIQYDGDGMAYVYQVNTRNRNFGVESYLVKIGVTIEDWDDKNVAVKASLTDIVLSSSAKLSELAAVTVIEE